MSSIISILKLLLWVIVICIAWLFLSQLFINVISYLFIRPKNFKFNDINEVKSFLELLMENDNKDENLTYANSRNGVGNAFYKFLTLGDFQILAKYRCIAFIPFCLRGYVLTHNNMIVATIDKDKFKEIFDRYKY